MNLISFKYARWKFCCNNVSPLPSITLEIMGKKRLTRKKSMKETTHIGGGAGYNLSWFKMVKYVTRWCELNRGSLISQVFLNIHSPRHRDNQFAFVNKLIGIDYVIRSHHSGNLNRIALSVSPLNCSLFLLRRFEMSWRRRNVDDR